MHLNCTNSCKNQQREQLQLDFDQCFLNGDKSALREQYKTLRQIELNNNNEYDNEIIDISSLAQSISIASDILIAETGISVIYCGNKTSPAFCNQRHFTKSLLNLISNAYLYGCENLITIKTIEMANFIRVEVQSGGAFINSNWGKGLCFVNKICQNANGRFFIEQSPTHTSAVMIFEKVRNYKYLSSVDFSSFLNDRLSPVYVELFGMEYH